jgi:hypothetical protein
LGGRPPFSGHGPNGIGVGGGVGAERTALGLLSRLSVKTREDSVENGQICLFDG